MWEQSGFVGTPLRVQVHRPSRTGRSACSILPRTSPTADAAVIVVGLPLVSIRRLVAVLRPRGPAGEGRPLSGAALATALALVSCRADAQTAPPPLQSPAISAPSTVDGVALPSAYDGPPPPTGARTMAWCATPRARRPCEPSGSPRRWEYQPGSEFFIVLNEQRDTVLSGFPGLTNRALIVKINKLFRR